MYYQYPQRCTSTRWLLGGLRQSKSTTEEWRGMKTKVYAAVNDLLQIQVSRLGLEPDAREEQPVV